MSHLAAKDLDKRWERMIRELDAHEGVSIRKSELSRPAKPKEQREIADALGIPLTPDLSAYLSFSNGLSLEWRVEGAWAFGGSIHIPDLRTIANPAKRPGPSDALEVPLQAYGLDMDRAEGKIFPFDFFQGDEDNIELACFLPRGESLDVFVSEDNIACITDTLLLSFGEYLDLILRAYGSPMARAALQQGRMNRKSTRAAKACPGILEKSYSLSALIDLCRAGPNVQEVRDFFR